MENYQPDSIHAYQHRGKYIFLKKDATHKGGVIFDPRSPNEGLITFNQYFVAGYRDQDTDTLYLIDENKVLFGSLMMIQHNHYHTPGSQNDFSLDAPHCFTAARVLADSYTNITINVYADNTLYHTQAVTKISSHFRLPRNGSYRVWQVEITGTDNVREVIIGETVIELQT